MHLLKHRAAVVCVEIGSSTDTTREDIGLKECSRVCRLPQITGKITHFRNSSMSAMDTWTSRMPRFSGAGAPG